MRTIVLLCGFFTCFASALYAQDDYTLVLQTGTFPSQKFDELPADYSGYLFLKCTQGIQPESARSIIGFYGRGWTLVKYHPTDRNRWNNACTRFVIPTPEMRISKQNPNCKEWWIYFPEQPPVNAPFIPVPRMQHIYRFQGDILSLKTWQHLPWIWAEPTPGPGEPDYFRITTASGLPQRFTAGTYLTGKGIGIQINDDGYLRHIDFTHRVNQIGITTLIDFLNDTKHVDYVAGIAAGAGIKTPVYKGMAPGAQILNQMYSNDPTILSGLFIIDSLYMHQGARVSNTSYSDGCNTGYTLLSALIDQQCISNPGLVHVFSSGNSGTHQCGYGATAGFGTITGGHKLAKNALTIGNVYVSEVLVHSSSKGPATDGRLKPDLVAPGQQIITSTKYYEYMPMSGTSMSAPMVSGLSALLMEQFKTSFGYEAPGPLIRATMMNTAKDLGLPGPDFSYGYGLIQPYHAINAIANQNFILDTLPPGQSRNFSIQVPAGIQKLSIMLHYNDVPAAPGASTALVQDADLKVIAPDGTTFLPWVCFHDPAQVQLPAVRNTDHLNNTEQITVSLPDPGTWTIEVNAFNLPAGNLPFVIVYYLESSQPTLIYPQSGEILIAEDSLEIKWHPGQGSELYTPEYSLNGGITWSGFGVQVGQQVGKKSVKLPAGIASRKFQIRLKPTPELTSGNNIIAPRPWGAQVDSICGAAMYISWQPVSGAIAYRLWKLQQNQMVPIGPYYTGTNIITHDLNPTNTPWMAVSAIFPDSIESMRSDAFTPEYGIPTCPSAHDFSLTSGIFPFSGKWVYAFDSTEVPGKVAGWFYVTNNGTQVPGPLRIRSSMGLDTLIAPPAPGQSLLVKTFDFYGTHPGTTEYRIWLENNGDMNAWNDTLLILIKPGTEPLIPEPTPYWSNWDQENTCFAPASCELYYCNMSNNWLNADNHASDHIDFMIGSGTTPSGAGAGPTGDASPDGTGKYLYTEASGCFNRNAQLWSPAILPMQDSVWIRFHYQMKATNNGIIQLDCVTDTSWQTLWKKSGNQGPDWVTAQIPFRKSGNLYHFFRLFAQTGSDFLSDIAIDGFSITHSPILLAPPSETDFCKNAIHTVQLLGNHPNAEWKFSLNNITWNATGNGPHMLPAGNSGIVHGYVLPDPNQPEDIFFFNYLLVGFPIANFNTISNSGGKINFTDQSSDAVHWFWDFGDGNTSTEQSPVHTYQANGNYSVKLIISNACGTDSIVKNIEVNNVGIETLNPELTWSIYPNPFYRKVTINALNEITDISWQLRDMGGRIIDSGVLNEKTIVFDFGNLDTGVYLLHLNTGHGPMVFRLMKWEE